MEITENELQSLARTALKARSYSYVPYSHFAVGAALMTEDGRIYRGGNIENAAYSVAVCAERTAIFKAVSEGERKFKALAVCGGKAGTEPENFCTPCGVCRQVMAELCGLDMPVYLVKSAEEIKKYTVRELLPLSFRLEQNEK